MLKGHFERQRTVVLAKLDGRKTRERWTKSLQFKADDETLDDDDLEQTLDTRDGNVKLDADMLFATAVWKKQLSSDAYTFLLSMIEDYGAQAADDMGVTWLGIKDPVLAAQIQRSLDNLVLIEDTTHDAIQSAINEGEIAKVPADDLRNSVEDVFDAAVDTRAALIAGDVVHGTQQMSTVAAGRQAASQDQAAIASGAKPVGLGEGYTGPSKTWVTQGDERVRDWHEDADGQEVPVDQPFDVGGESLMYPGDPDGSPGNVINCRCFVFVSRPGGVSEQTEDEDPYDLIGDQDLEDEPKSRGYQLGSWRQYRIKQVQFKYADGQDRDEHGRWSSGGSALEGQGRLESMPKAFQAKVNTRIKALGLDQDAIIANMETLFERGSKEDEAWFDGAHQLAGDLADKYNTTPEKAAAVIAAMSPLREWGKNAQDAETVLKLVSGHIPVTVSQEMADTFNEKAPKGAVHLTAGTFDSHSLDTRALATSYPGLMNKAGAGTAVTAIALARGADIDKTLSGPKVRSFYNNITHPKDPSYATIDTWMYRAALDTTTKVNGAGGPQTATEIEAAGRYLNSVFQGSPSMKGTVATGVGTYPWFVSTISKAAEAHGILPDEYQSRVWSVMVRENA